jgi:predicted RNA-binding Zn ribbon-like protein
MPDNPQAAAEWIDGFLFLGNHLAVDFVNTRPVLDEGPKELLPDMASLERWLVAAGVLSSAKQAIHLRRWRDSPKAAAFLKRLMAFREALREEILRQDGGLPISEPFLAELNRLLARHPSRMAVQRQAKELSLNLVFEPREPEDVWAPIAAAAADLLSGVPKDRVRKCEAESCVLHFYDTSKKGSRRWCSMNLCGNKVKVAAYQQRRRGESER